MTSDEYWSLDIPGLTFEQANRIKEFALADSKWGVIITDPRRMMVRGFDASTVKLLVGCLKIVLDRESFEGEDEAGVRSLLEDCEAWLEQSDSSLDNPG